MSSREQLQHGKAQHDRPALIFMWEQFAPYHVDRIEAVAEAFGSRFTIVGIEVSARSNTYAWKPAPSGDTFERHTLFTGIEAETIPWRQKLRKSLAVINSYRARAVFLCNQDQKEILAALVLLRLRGVPTYALLDAKFDDRPRKLLQESLKPLVFRLFSGGIAGGERHIAYHRFLGLPAGWIAPGYSAVSTARVRAEAETDLAPAGLPHAERDFVLVARFVDKKDIGTAIRAYARFRALHPQSRRRLVLCGSGASGQALHALADQTGVADGVVFAGFLDAAAVSRTVARALALVLTSLQEPWGLVVNEAVSLNIPVLCTENVGARDTLVRNGVNGFIVEAGNDEGLARFMGMLADDAALWREMSLACARFAPLADAPAFAAGVGLLVGETPDTLDQAA